ncbi:unnamed protein product [Miscanthus lutarioriparius]|uniref:Uncharacterized protein n=1 Tax=Miscanthus lutarioriparius TaxID=422564 RepID=A0A811RCB8_9POAL|nr:unnamed protein product [Miscanthus lutarioriparius]
MAREGGGWLPLDLSLATAGPSASAGERRPNRRTVSSLYAELGAMLPNLPTDRVSPCPALDGPASWLRRRRRVVPQDELFFLSPSGRFV